MGATLPYEQNSNPPEALKNFLNDLLPYYAHAIDCFGPERCMFESNFPVDKECISYRTLWNLLRR